MSGVWRHQAGGADRGLRMFRDIDGIPSLAAHRDEVVTVEISWSRRLRPGEGIVTVTNTSGGPTLTGATNSETTTSVLAQGFGQIEVKVTTGGGRTLVETINIYERNSGHRRTPDYGSNP